MESKLTTGGLFGFSTFDHCLCLFASLYTPYIKYDSEQLILSSFPHLSYFCVLGVHILGMMHVTLLIDELLQSTPRSSIAKSYESVQKEIADFYKKLGAES